MDTRTRVRSLYDFLHGPPEPPVEGESPSGSALTKKPGNDTVVIQVGVQELLAQLYNEADSQPNQNADRV